MKRKLDENDAPSPAAAKDEGKASTRSFSDLGLDSRLLQAIAQQQYQEPTLVQLQAIPLALDGKDLIARAKTGSGKTAAYVLPLLQSILRRKQVCHFNCLAIGNRLLIGPDGLEPFHHCPDPRADARAR